MKDATNDLGLAKVASVTDSFLDKNALVTTTGERKYAMNIQNQDNNYKLQVSAPGFKKSDFKITVANGMLTIIAESNDTTDDNPDNHFRKEYSHASFAGSFCLPEDVLEDHIAAKYHNGVFTVNLKKSGNRTLLKKRQMGSVPESPKKFHY